MDDAVSLERITAARDVIAAVVRHTPVVSSVVLSARYDRPVVFKAESLQRTGSFKIRGAMNKLATLGEEARAGVTAGSAGNHAQAVAFAARYFGVPCDVGSSRVDLQACKLEYSIVSPK